MTPDALQGHSPFPASLAPSAHGLRKPIQRSACKRVKLSTSYTFPSKVTFLGRFTWGTRGNVPQVLWWAEGSPSVLCGPESHTGERASLGRDGQRRADAYTHGGWAGKGSGASAPPPRAVTGRHGVALRLSIFGLPTALAPPPQTPEPGGRPWEACLSPSPAPRSASAAGACSTPRSLGKGRS